MYINATGHKKFFNRVTAISGNDCNFSAACIFIIVFGDHVIKIFVVDVMLWSVCVVVLLGQQLVLWCIIETSFQMLFLPP